MKKKFGKKVANRAISCLLSTAMIMGGIMMTPFETMEAKAATDAKAKNTNLNQKLCDSNSNEYYSITRIGNLIATDSNNEDVTEWTGLKVYFGGTYRKGV